jgi:hypothetical protein
MSQLEEQEIDTGQSQENKEKQSSPVSKAKKREKEKTKAQEEEPSKKLLTQTLKKMTMSTSENEPGSTLEIMPKKDKSLLQVPKLSDLQKRSEQALKRLRVKPEVLASAPKITPIIKRDLKGGLKSALEAMRFSTEDSDIREFLKVYDKVPIEDRKRIPWEAIAIKAKVNPKHLLGAIRLSVESHCWNRSRFIAVSNHPAITKARVNFGLEHVGAEKDRTALDITVGILPKPSGQKTTINLNQNNLNANGRGGDDDEDGKTVDASYESKDGFDDLFPSPNEVQEKLVPIRQRLLEG